MAEQYVINEQGKHVAVLLDMADYQRLKQPTADDQDLLLTLSQAELEALADGQLAPAAQTRLDELLIRNQEGQLSTEDSAELDRLLLQVDQLTILKTRARYTLNHHQTVAKAA